MRTPVALVLLAALAGCVTPQDAPVATQAAIPDAPLLATEEPFAFDGSFGPGAVACPVLTCQGVSLGARSTPLDFTGVLVGANFTLTWTAAAPHMQELRLGFRWGPNDDPQYEVAEGPSPVVLALEDLNLTAADEPVLWAWPVTPVPMGLATVHTAQDFRVEGALALAPKP